MKGLQGILEPETVLICCFRECPPPPASRGRGNGERRGREKKAAFIKEDFVVLNSKDQTGYNGVSVSETSYLPWPPCLAAALSLARGGVRKD